MNYDPIKVALWTKHQQDWAESGLSLSAYCRRAGIGYSTFYTWRKRLNTVPINVPATQAVVPKKPTTHSPIKPKLIIANASTLSLPSIGPNKLVPVSIKAPLPEIALHSPAGWQVIISSHIDLPALAQLLLHLP